MSELILSWDVIKVAEPLRVVHHVNCWKTIRKHHWGLHRIFKVCSIYFNQRSSEVKAAMAIQLKNMPLWCASWTFNQWEMSLKTAKTWCGSARYETNYPNMHQSRLWLVGRNKKEIKFPDSKLLWGIAAGDVWHVCEECVA